MRRSVLVTLVVLGSLISLIGSTGLFAALTDTAQTGQNSVDSGELAASADIQLATATVDQGSGEYDCGLFADDLTTAFFTTGGAGGSYIFDDVVPGSVSAEFPFCLANLGSQSIVLSAFAIELTDLDTGCTGDELLYDGTSCGGGQAGELAPNLSLRYTVRDCADSSQSNAIQALLSYNAMNAVTLTTIPLLPTQFTCVGVTVLYPATTPETDAQAAQSDTVTWRFQFIGDATP